MVELDSAYVENRATYNKIKVFYKKGIKECENFNIYKKKDNYAKFSEYLVENEDDYRQTKILLDDLLR